MAGSIESPVLVWFRRDLRLRDNPALSAAVATGRPVIALYVLDDTLSWAPGGASRWWLHGNLATLSDSLDAIGCPLVLRQGPAEAVVPEVAHACGAHAVFWNRRYEPTAIAVDGRIKAALRQAGLEVHSRNGSLLFEPWTVTTRAGGPFRVFTPFWRACLASVAPDAPLPAPESMAGGAPTTFESMALDALGLLPTRPDWSGGLCTHWQPGELAAATMLDEFLSNESQCYDYNRDIPGHEGTSRLSPYLAAGVMGPRQVWHAVLARGARPDMADGPGVFLKELVWREFSYHLLYHQPGLPDRNLDAAFEAMPWQEGGEALGLWQRGRTGYPVVDAGMRQLWATGWMHNRVRMVVASFLTKHLMVHWREGARWFWDTLVDADLASNSASWQWVAGCGADAAPFFRIFNPVTQGERFDAKGDYVRTWVPELARLPDRFLHKPWAAPAAVLGAAGVRLGVDYPGPVVDHDAARARALAAWQDHVRTARHGGG